MEEKRVNGALVGDEIPTPEDVQEFMTKFFKNWTEGQNGRKGQRFVSLDSRRKDFFPTDGEKCALGIGLYISEKFGLREGLCFTWSLHDHSFPIPDKSIESAFYKKYPKETIPDQTLKGFSEMVYDLILIQNGLPFS